MEPHSAFNNLDYIVIGVVLLSGLLALMRGFLRELFSLIAWAGAYFAATKFYAPALPLAHHYLKNEQAAEWGAMAIVFVAVLIVLMIVGHFFCALIKGTALTAVDRTLGFFYGMARGFLVVSLLYLSAVMIFWPDLDTAEQTQQENGERNPAPELLVQAKTRPLLAYGAQVLRILVPKEMINKNLKNIEEQKEEMEKNARQKALDSLPDASTFDAEHAPSVDVKKLFNLEDKQ